MLFAIRDVATIVLVLLVLALFYSIVISEKSAFATDTFMHFLSTFLGLY